MILILRIFQLWKTDFSQLHNSLTEKKYYFLSLLNMTYNRTKKEVLAIIKNEIAKLNLKTEVKINHTYFWSTEKNAIEYNLIVRLSESLVKYEEDYEAFVWRIYFLVDIKVTPSGILYNIYPVIK